MSLTKTASIDQITVVENGCIFAREATVIKENDVELNTSYNRFCLTPGQDLTDQPANIVAIATVVWTPEVISAYEAEIAILQKTLPVGA